MILEGELISINISEEKGVRKTPVESALITDTGLQGDAHAGDWHRQVSLLAEESIDKMRGKGVDINYGDFAENLTVKGLDLLSLPIGTQIKVGEEVLLEVTQKGKECHQGCAIRQLIGDCVMPREGIFTKIIKGGRVKIGDRVAVVE